MEKNATTAWTEKAEARPPQPALDQIAARLSSQHNALVFVHDQLDGVLGRAFGNPAPTAASTGKPREVRTGTIGAIEEHLDRTNDLISDITSMLARLETLA